MKLRKEARCNAEVFTPIYGPSAGQGHAFKYRLAFNLNGPGKMDWRGSKAAVENTAIIYSSVMQQRLSILLHLFIHSL